MKTTSVMVLLMAAVAATVMLAQPALGQQEKPGVPPGIQETTETPGEYCGICEARRNVNELAPWLNWGFDIRAREEYIKNPTLDDDASTGLGSEDLWTRVRPRIWLQAKPVEELDLSINARLIWEYWLVCKPDSSPSVPDTNVLFDDLNVRWANIGDMPLAVTVGRQQMRFGDGWLIFEGTPGDGSRTVYFDAIRGTYTADEMATTFDAVYVENRADTRDSLVPPFNNMGANDPTAKGRYIAENNERGLILYAQNKSIQSTQIDGYFVWFHQGAGQGPTAASNTPDNAADIYTLGARVAGDMTDNIQARAEGAFQFGNNQIGSVDGTSQSLCGAWGLNSRLTYNFHDDYETAGWAGYEARSGGEDPAENFNILWGRYPQWSDLYNGYVDRIDGRPAASPNLHRLYAGGGFTPCKPLTFQANYHLLFVDNNNVDSPAVTDNGCFRGQLVTALLKYQFAEHIAGHLQGEAFFPGDYYSNDNNDVGFFARYEIVFTW